MSGSALNRDAGRAQGGVRHFDVGRLDPVEAALEAFLFGPEAALLFHMWRRIDDTIGEEVL